MRFICLASLVLCAFLIGCDQATLMKEFTSATDEAVARNYAEQLRQAQFDQIEHDLDPSVVVPNPQDTFSKMSAYFPPGTPTSVKVVGSHTSHRADTYRSDITLEYQFPAKWLLVEVFVQYQADLSKLMGLRVTVIPDSLENLYRFRLAGKSLLQYLTLIGAVASLLFTFYVFVLCIRSKDVKPKWLWLIIVLVGFSCFSVDWYSGQWSYQLLSIRIPCFAMSHAFYGSWIVAAYFPLGAIAFLQRRWKMKITGQSIPATPATPNPEPSSSPTP